MLLPVRSTPAVNKQPMAAAMEGLEGSSSHRLAAAMSWPPLSYRALGSTAGFDWWLIDSLACKLLHANGIKVMRLHHAGFGWTTGDTALPAIKHACSPSHVGWLPDENSSVKKVVSRETPKPTCKSCALRPSPQALSQPRKQPDWYLRLSYG